MKLSSSLRSRYPLLWTNSATYPQRGGCCVAAYFIVVQISAAILHVRTQLLIIALGLRQVLELLELFEYWSFGV